MVLVHIDDMLLTCRSLKLIEETKKFLFQAFKMKDLGELKYFLDIEFARSDKRILMHLKKYFLKLIYKVGTSVAKNFSTPIDTNVKLTNKQCDGGINKEKGSRKNEENPSVKPGPYQRLIGKLLYLTMTRPDISYGVQSLTQFLQNPKSLHMEAAIRIVKYIKDQQGQRVLLSSELITNISLYSDAGCTTCPLTRKSIPGLLVKLRNSLISWKSKKQSIVSRRSITTTFF